tara:strand:- start:117 stop:593 length:477 start_codon:yes stop_codon:yes gene_type:complete
MHSKKYNNSKTQNFIQGLRPLSSTIPKGLKKILKKNGYNFSSIVDNWTKMVGKNISYMCYPSRLRAGKEFNNGTLILNVIHGNEVNIEYKKQEIIEKINIFFGYKCIKEVKLKVMHKKKIIKNTKVNSMYSNKLDSIKNDQLKNSLSKLIEAYNSKND